PPAVVEGAWMTGRVAVLSAPERFELRRAEAPAAGAAEVVVRVQECGICGSDLKMWAGTHAFMRPPIVMGHEIAGVVEAVARGSPAPEDRCVVIGAGSIGLFTALVLRHCGVGDVVVSDLLPDRRRRAEEIGFATIDPTSESLRDAVGRMIRAEGADAVYECV